MPQAKDDWTPTVLCVADIADYQAWVTNGKVLSQTSPGSSEAPAGPGPPIASGHHNGFLAVGLNQIEAVDPLTGATQRGPMDQLAGAAMTWSPDRQQIITASGGELRRYAIGSNHPYTALASISGADWSPIAWSPDGTEVARITQSSIDLYSPTSGALLRSLAFGGATIAAWSLSWSVRPR